MGDTAAGLRGGEVLSWMDGWIEGGIEGRGVTQQQGLYMRERESVCVCVCVSIVLCILQVFVRPCVRAYARMFVCLVLVWVLDGINTVSPTPSLTYESHKDII